MTTLAWIIVGGVTMSALALTGSATLLLPERLFDRVVPSLVALAAGTLLGGACFHMLPEAVDAIGNRLEVYVWLVGGFVGFFILEQYLHWHHCHRPLVRHGPLGYLILVADGIHNLIGGLAVARPSSSTPRSGLSRGPPRRRTRCHRSWVTSGSWSMPGGADRGRCCSTSSRR